MTRVRRPQSNGILGSFHRTLLDEHFRMEGRCTRIEAIVEMQAVLDDYLEGYNSRMPHQGYGLNGGTPIHAFTEGLSKTHHKGGHRTRKIHQHQSRLIAQSNAATVRGTPPSYRP